MGFNVALIGVFCVQNLFFSVILISYNEYACVCEYVFSAIDGGSDGNGMRTKDVCIQIWAQGMILFNETNENGENGEKKVTGLLAGFVCVCA